MSKAILNDLHRGIYCLEILCSYEQYTTFFLSISAYHNAFQAFLTSQEGLSKSWGSNSQSESVSVGFFQDFDFFRNFIILVTVVDVEIFLHWEFYSCIVLLQQVIIF